MRRRGATRPDLRHAASQRRAFSLLEAAIVTVALALAVPPAFVMLGDVAAGQGERLRAVQASTLAEAVLETVLADVASDEDGLGFEALADDAAYIDTPFTGLRARLALIAAPYEDAGLTYDIAIGGLVAADGVASGDALQDVHRVVTVTVTAPAASGADDLSMPFSVLVTEIQP